MTRKEMIIAIADEAGCSRRLVRKKLFERCTELKKTYPTLLFYKVFLDKNTNWIRRDHHDWLAKNGFEVCAFPSGVVVLFYNIAFLDNDGDISYTDHFGVRLWTWKH